MANLHSLRTEQSNPNTENIDTFSCYDIAKAMNDEDAGIAKAVGQVLPSIASIMEMAVESLSRGGSIYYVGTGSSGRLGVLDASEIPATFNADPDHFVGLIAGGDAALRISVAEMEDKETAGAEILRGYPIGARDLVIGLTSSGRTPFVKGALQEASRLGAKTALISCNKGSLLSPLVDVAAEIEVGPEVIAGSTRLKAGTAQKMALNMISTGAMIRLGKVYKNRMVDLKVGNHKLYERAIRTIQDLTGVDRESAENTYQASGQNVKAAIVHLTTGLSMDEVHRLLQENGGSIRKAISGKQNA